MANGVELSAEPASVSAVANGEVPSPRTPGLQTSSERLGREMWLALQKTFGDEVPSHLEERMHRLAFNQEETVSLSSKTLPRTTAQRVSKDSREALFSPRDYAKGSSTFIARPGSMEVPVAVATASHRAVSKAVPSAGNGYQASVTKSTTASASTSRSDVAEVSRVLTAALQQRQKNLQQQKTGSTASSCRAASPSTRTSATSPGRRSPGRPQAATSTAAPPAAPQRAVVQPWDHGVAREAPANSRRRSPGRQQQTQAPSFVSRLFPGRLPKSSKPVDEGRGAVASPTPQQRGKREGSPQRGKAMPVAASVGSSAAAVAAAPTEMGMRDLRQRHMYEDNGTPDTKASASLNDATVTTCSSPSSVPGQPGGRRGAAAHDRLFLEAQQMKTRRTRFTQDCVTSEREQIRLEAVQALRDPLGRGCPSPRVTPCSQGQRRIASPARARGSPPRQRPGGRAVSPGGARPGSPLEKSRQNPAAAPTSTPRAAAVPVRQLRTRGSAPAATSPAPDVMAMDEPAVPASRGPRGYHSLELPPAMSQAPVAGYHSTEVPAAMPRTPQLAAVKPGSSASTSASAILEVATPPADDGPCKEEAAKETARRDLIAMKRQLGLLLTGVDILKRKVATVEAHSFSTGEDLAGAEQPPILPPTPELPAPQAVRHSHLRGASAEDPPRRPTPPVVMPPIADTAAEEVTVVSEDSAVPAPGGNGQEASEVAAAQSAIAQGAIKEPQAVAEACPNDGIQAVAAILQPARGSVLLPSADDAPADVDAWRRLQDAPAAEYRRPSCSQPEAQELLSPASPRVAEHIMAGTIAGQEAAAKVVSSLLEDIHRLQSAHCVSTEDKLTNIVEDAASASDAPMPPTEDTTDQRLPLIANNAENGAMLKAGLLQPLLAASDTESVAEYQVLLEQAFSPIVAAVAAQAQAHAQRTMAMRSAPVDASSGRNWVWTHEGGEQQAARLHGEGANLAFHSAPVTEATPTAYLPELPGCLLQRPAEMPVAGEPGRPEGIDSIWV